MTKTYDWDQTTLKLPSIGEMQADKVLRHFMLKHFGTYQSWEIKALKVTDFCWGKEKKKKQPQTSQSTEVRLYMNTADKGKENFLAWKYLVCAKQQQRQQQRIPESARINRKIYSGLFC